MAPKKNKNDDKKKNDDKNNKNNKNNNNNNKNNNDSSSDSDSDLNKKRPLDNNDNNDKNKRHKLNDDYDDYVNHILNCYDENCEFCNGEDDESYCVGCEDSSCSCNEKEDEEDEFEYDDSFDPDELNEADNQLNEKEYIDYIKQLDNKMNDDDIEKKIIFHIHLNDNNNLLNDDDDYDENSNHHKFPERTATPFERITVKDFVIKKELINKENIECLNDLIVVLDHNEAVPKQKELVIALKSLENLIGMKTIKDQILNQILLFIQNLYDPGMFLHTVITGSPGCGKTTVSHIMAKIYKSMGFLVNDKVVVADRASLIAGYLGQTAIKTKKVLESAIGGIILIDEAYSLGARDGEDSFSKECIDTINQFLSEHSEELICIIAGYKDDIENCFFKKNAGLKRRFPWTFNIDNYSPEELYLIFVKLLGIWELQVPKEKIIAAIKKNLSSFTNNGGDMQILLDRCKITHARRVFGSDAKRQITEKDFDEGLKNFISEKKPKIVTTHTDFTNLMYN